MKYFFDIAYAIELLSLAAGVKLILSACKHDNCWSGFAKLIGLFITVMSVVMLSCTAMHGYKQWTAGGFDMPMMSMQAKADKAVANDGKKAQ